METTPIRGVWRLALGMILVVLGVLLLLDRALDVDVFSLSWPIFIILPGIVMLVAAITNQRGRGLAIPGSIVTATGLLLLAQQAFDLYASWAYAWALIAPTAVGFGLWLWGRLDSDDGRAKTGAVLMQIGLILFAAGFIFFELILNLNDFSSHAFAEVAGAALLIAGGFLLIYWGFGRTRGRTGARS